MEVAVGEAAEVAGEGEDEGGEDDPGELRRKFQEAAGDEGKHDADEEEKEMAEDDAAGFAVRLDKRGDLHDGGGDVAGLGHGVR